MKFYKDAERLADIFIFENGSKFILYWSEHAELVNMNKWCSQNIRKLVKLYGHKLHS